jgi:hypothetical protein
MKRPEKDILNGTADALHRTLLLMRDDLVSEVTDAELLQALLGVTIVLEADEITLGHESAQHAFVTAALLAIRSGATVVLRAPNVKLRGQHAPLRGDRLITALLESNGDVIPGLGFATDLPTEPADLTVLLGATPSTSLGARSIRMNADTWAGEITPLDDIRPWGGMSSPFGALTAAGLVAVEAYKVAMRRLREFAAAPAIFEEFFAATSRARIELAPKEMSFAGVDLGKVDFISGGAITQSTLYALLRIPSVEGTFRVVEPKTSDAPDLNRYPLLRASALGALKAEDLARQDLGRIRIEGFPLRYDESTQSQVDPLGPAVVVGVDDIPTRWLVQRTAATSWIGIGATSHYMAMASAHVAGLPCARCLHPYDEPGPELIPTVAWVSHFAGLWVASLLIRHRLGVGIDPGMQVIFASLLVASQPRSVWRDRVPARQNCPNRCGR